MENKEKYICMDCQSEIVVSPIEAKCVSCGKKYLSHNGIPQFSDDQYWGKIKESELLSIIDVIEKEGFSAFTKDMQKKLDFTYDEDRADWRYFIPLNSSAVALDIGSGLGRITIPLARVCKTVVSCDLSLSRMKFLSARAKAENLHNVQVFVGDVYNLPLQEKSFDLIVMNGVLEWVGLTKKFSDPREAQIESLRICKKLLKPGGHLYIGIENRIALVYLKAKDHGGLRYTSYMPRKIANWYSKIRGNKHGYRTYTYSKNGYEKLIHEAGFANPAQFYLLYPGYNLPRIIIPYEHIPGFQYLIRTFKRSTSILKNSLYWIVSSGFGIRLYRLVFFSFGIVIKNDQ